MDMAISEALVIPPSKPKSAKKKLSPVEKATLKKNISKKKVEEAEDDSGLISEYQTAFKDILRW